MRSAGLDDVAGVVVLHICNDGMTAFSLCLRPVDLTKAIEKRHGFERIGCAWAFGLQDSQELRSRITQRGIDDAPRPERRALVSGLALLDKAAQCIVREGCSVPACIDLRGRKAEAGVEGGA